MPLAIQRYAIRRLPSIVTPPVLTPYDQPVDENQSILYHANVDIPTGITWSLTGTDAEKLQVSALGVVSLKAGVLNYEAQPAWSFTLTATDAAGNISTPLDVTVNISNIDEVAPIFKSEISASVASDAASGRSFTRRMPAIQITTRPMTPIALLTVWPIQGTTRKSVSTR